MTCHPCLGRAALAMALALPLLPCQSPTPIAVDPGPLVTDGATGLDIPAGSTITHLLTLGPQYGVPADLVFGPGGDIYFTQQVGATCNTVLATHIWRIPMAGNQPAQPLNIQTYTTQPVEGHQIVFDPGTGDFYAAGTCSQTSNVYRIPASGVPQVVNPGTPLNDPDGIALGQIPGSSTGPHLFVTAQDQLVALDTSMGATPPVTPVQVNLTGTGAAGIGNWGFPVFDANTGTLLATNTGNPTTLVPVELAITPALSATATVFGPTSARFRGADLRGMRILTWGFKAGIANPSPSGPTFVPLVETFAGHPFVAIAPDGSWFVLDEGDRSLYRIDFPFKADALMMSSSAGGVLNFTLDAPSPRGNEAYLIVAGVSGGTPGSMYGPSLVPVNFDALSQLAYALVLAGDPILPGWNGMLDASGHATAALIFPPGIIPSGFTFQFAFLLGNPEYGSNATWVHVTP